jgi:AcrR family transcriptional regulator
VSVRGSTRSRLPASERREAVVAAALRVFASTSYAGATTAEIAREAGVSEPIIYRHFASKRELWFACLDEAWTRFRAVLEAKFVELGEADSVRAVGQAGLQARRERVQLPNLWMQGVTEAAEDAEIQKVVRRHVREVHDFVAGTIRRAQAAGGVPADRDPDAEAWIILAGGFLVSFSDRLGGVLSHGDFEAIGAQRHRWLLGHDAPAS